MKSVSLSSNLKDAVSHRYLGSKVRLISWICSILGFPPSSHARLIDLFSGTGIVSKNAAARGWRIVANDHLYCAAIMTKAQLASSQTCKFQDLGSYSEAIAQLNRSSGREGFVWREYTPSLRSRSGNIRYYFTSENGTRIDGIRATIAQWKESSKIGDEEEALLIADLLSAANRVANIAGTYGCFLKPWQLNAIRPLELICRNLLKNRVLAEVHCADASTIPTAPSDVAYIDPPYTKRQHAAYYHILETIARGDEPEVDGVTGLRPWRDQASDFCYRARAKAALQNALDRLSCRRILLSYSSEGHLSENDVIEVIDNIGQVTQYRSIVIPKYRSNGGPSLSAAGVREMLFEVQR